ncbi:SAF domain protein [compost metagenome]
MMKKAQRLLVASALGLATSGALFYYVNSSATEADAGVPKGTVLVAIAPIPANSKVTPDQVKVESRPVAFIPQGAALMPEEVVGRVSKAELYPGEAVLDAKFYPAGQEASMVLPVPPGKRAVTVAVDEVVGVAGFVQPGSLVDVVGTLDIDNQPVSKVLLQKIQVLAIAQDYEKKEEQEAKVVSSATLAVTPQESEVLILAADRGKIRLAMRSANEEEDVKTTGITPEALTSKPKAPATRTVVRTGPTKTVTRTVKVPVPKPDEAILVIRGTSTEQVYR